MNINQYLAKRLYNLGEMQFTSKICEELSELQTAYLHFKDNKVDVDSVIEEIADVMIQLDKVVYEISKFKDMEIAMTKYKINEQLYKKIDHIKELTKDC